MTFIIKQYIAKFKNLVANGSINGRKACVDGLALVYFWSAIIAMCIPFTSIELFVSFFKPEFSFLIISFVRM